MFTFATQKFFIEMIVEEISGLICKAYTYRSISGDLKPAKR